MTLVPFIKHQDARYQEITPVGTWAWTTRMDVSGAFPIFQIREITTPYGLLRDSIPIPGNIVLKMAESIAEMQQAYSPAITVGPPTILTFTVNEGQGCSAPQRVGVTNTGSYGSILCTAFSTSAAYLTVNPNTET